MSNTTTSSDDKLYMTEDLEGRLDPNSLEMSPKADEKEDFYANVNGGLVTSFEMPKLDLPDPPNVMVAVFFENGESFTLDGPLSSLSFGHEGWLLAFAVEDSKTVFPIVLRAAKNPISSVLVSLPNGNFSMITNVDCTVSFSYGSATISVTSDEARYV